MHPNPRGNQRCPVPDAGLQGPKPWRIPCSILHTTLADSGKRRYKGSYFIRHHGFNAKKVNSSLIVLIPNLSSPTSVNHFRPINLCNMVYKIISKLLVEKLRPLLDKLISPSQSTFMPNRWIAENQIIVQEILHSFETRKTKLGLMAIKLVLQKTYDKVNWKLLIAVLLHFGFTETFIRWIMACVSLVSFEVVVNKGKSKCFNQVGG